MNCINFLLISKASVIQLSRKHRLFVPTRWGNRTAYLHSQVWLTRHFSAWSEALQVYLLFSLFLLLFTLVCFTRRSSLHFSNLDPANALFFPAKSYPSNANFSLINSKHQLGGSIEWAYLHFLPPAFSPQDERLGLWWLCSLGTEFGDLRAQFNLKGNLKLCHAHFWSLDDKTTTKHDVCELVRRVRECYTVFAGRVFSNVSS